MDNTMLTMLSDAKSKLDVARQRHQEILDARARNLAEFQRLSAESTELNQKLSDSFDVLHEAEDAYTNAAITYADFVVKK
jgi:cell shape-determining protein MreC